MNPESTNEAIFRGLTDAICSGNLDHVKDIYNELIEAMVGVSPPDLDMNCNMRDAAITAARTGHAHILDFLLSPNGATVEICGALSSSAALGSKAKGGSTDVFKVLLKYGWGPDMENAGYGNALTYSIVERNVPAIQFLLSHGASPSRCLQQHGNGTYRNGYRRWAMPYGLTPLDYAGGHGTPEIINILLAYGADVTKCDALHHTASALAKTEEEEQGYHEMIQLLLKNGMDINKIEGDRDKERLMLWGITQDNWQKYPLGTPLHYATRTMRTERVRFLLKIGADRNVKATNGLTPREWIEGSEDFWDEEIAEMLRTQE